MGLFEQQPWTLVVAVILIVEVWSNIKAHARAAIDNLRHRRVTD